ncbi:restriction endonuclease subunit S [Actinacidiphila epipremni]|uniref:Type I restriction modification DNA specificity domain-containing protein n=1 Tax=Actinacidiphila epipremni TaxID=2053013 RepID=A0ABX0ZS88_9ACTN|nr:restriction endonuclease subunit S [Actinacidiphila epipremni]NJP44488.1 hypothetical protein [Actinacidiphila epipremni]
MARTITTTGGREATTGVIPGRWALSVGDPKTPTAPGFRWVKLSDLARLESGHTPSRRKPEYWGGDVPWLGIKDATANHGRTLTSTFQYVTDEGIANSSARVLPEGTVCLSRTASVGYVVTMGVPMATSQDFVNWVCGDEISSRYLNYILLSEQDSVRRFAHGTTHQTVYFPEAKAFHVCVPEREEQDAIVGVLGALDDKIAVNERISSGADELLRSLHRQEVARGLVSSCRLDQLASVVVGGTPSRGKPEFWEAGTINWINSGKANEIRIIEPSERIAELGLKGSSVKVMPPHTVIIGITGATMGRISRLEIPAGGSQNVAGVWAESRELNDWLFCEVRSRATDLTKHGTGGAQQHINRRVVAHLEVATPTPERLNAWASEASPLFELIGHSLRESRTLAALRDTLLPQLMSGKLRVRDAERIVEDAV